MPLTLDDLFAPTTNSGGGTALTLDDLFAPQQPEPTPIVAPDPDAEKYAAMYQEIGARVDPADYGPMKDVLTQDEFGNVQADPSQYEQLTPDSRSAVNERILQANEGAGGLQQGYTKLFEDAKAGKAEGQMELLGLPAGSSNFWYGDVADQATTRASLQAIGGLGQQIKETYQRYAGDSEGANATNRAGQAMRGSLEELGGSGLERNVRGATESTLKSLYAGRAGGLSAIIAWAAQGSYNDAKTQAIDSGMDESSAMKYAAAQGAIEGGVTALFQLIGFGGTEKLLAGDAKWQGVKAMLQGVAGELGEEQTIALGQMTLEKLAGVDPTMLSADQLKQVIADTTLQTALGFGMAQGVSTISEFASKPWPSRKAAKDAGLDQIVTTAKERRDLAEKVRNGLNGQQFTEQLRTAATSPEEADALLEIYKARASSAGESFDDYVGKRIKGVEKTTSDKSVYLAQRQSGKPDALAQPAYHGSPHKFDKFTTDAMGTGEGAQAYGWGLYFAGNEAVARYYRESLSSPARTVQQKAMEEYDQESDPQEAADLLFARTDLSPTERSLLESLRDNDWLGFDYPHQAVKAAMSKDFASRYDPTPELVKIVDAAKKQSGALYKVNLKPEEHEYLDWDKPLYDQSPQVLDALSALFGDDFSLADISGGSAYHRLMDMVDDDRESRGAKIGTPVEAKKAVSRMLNAHGVRGIRYLDGASRKRGEGHRNYVIFDDADIVIEEVLAQKKGPTPRGEVQFLKDEGTAIIRAFEGQNLSTLLHETGHIFRRDLAGDDLKIAERWAGARGGKWNRKAEEKFARGFENYLATGKAPTTKLAQVFEKFKNWLAGVYGAIKGTAIDVNISPEMRGVFDRLLTPADAEATVKESLTVENQQPTRTADDKPTSWVIYDREKRSPVFETFNPAVVKKLNNKKYAAVPIQEHLASFTDKSSESWYENGPNKTGPRLPSLDAASEQSITATPDILSQDLADRFRGLANQTALPEARAANYGADVAMGIPERKKWADAEQRAAQRIQADPTGELSRVIQRIDQANEAGGTINLEDMEDVALVNRLGDIISKDLTTPEARALHNKLRFAFRSARSEDARKMGYRDPLAVMDPEARKRKSITDAIAEPTPDEVAERKKARTPEQHAEVDRKMEERYTATKEALGKQGIDLDDVDSIVADPKKAAIVLNAFRLPHSFWDMLFEYRRNSILSGILTQATNLTGNLTFAPYKMTVERSAEAFVNLFTKDKKAASFGEFKYLAAGVLPGIRRGIRNAVTSWKTEMPALAYELGRDGNFKIEGARGAIPGKFGRLVRAIGYRPLAAADEFATSITATMEVGARAYRAGKSIGLEKSELSKFIEQQIDDLGSVAWSDAIAAADQAAFRGHKGVIADAAVWTVDLFRKIPGARYVVPFRDTPASIFEEGLKRVPGLGAIIEYAEARKHGSNVIDAGMTPALARQLIAMGALAVIWDAVEGDDPWITGAGDQGDPQMRDVTQRARPPQSIRFGDQWYSYARIEPFATIIATTADMAKSVQDGKPLNTVPAFGNQVKNKLYLDSIGDTFEMVSKGLEGDYSGAEKWLTSFNAGWVPNLYRQTISASEDEMPESRFWGKGEDRVKRFMKRNAQAMKFPFVETMPRYDIWGRPITYNEVGESFATSFPLRLVFPSRVKDLDKIQQADLALIRWNEKNPDDQKVYSEVQKYVKLPDGSGKKVTQYLTDEQHAQYAQLSGEIAAERVAGLIFDPVEPTASDIARIRKVITDARKEARKILLPTWTFD